MLLINRHIITEKDNMPEENHLRRYLLRTPAGCLWRACCCLWWGHLKIPQSPSLLPTSVLLLGSATLGASPADFCPAKCPLVLPSSHFSSFRLVPTSCQCAASLMLIPKTFSHLRWLRWPFKCHNIPFILWLLLPSSSSSYADTD